MMGPSGPRPIEGILGSDLWTEVDDYVSNLLVASDPALEQSLIDSRRAGLPPMHVSPNQGKRLQILTCAFRARTILEAGTLGGYSTIWMGRALPVDGHLNPLEASPLHVQVARTNIRGERVWIGS
ncbi:MAG: hypothetical protein HKL79_02485 [Thermoplasmata archaeon]|nr:hypothetical protein [Thermoplasmata archaeon]